jgi:hypothetical protein
MKQWNNRLLSVLSADWRKVFGSVVAILGIAAASRGWFTPRY